MRFCLVAALGLLLFCKLVFAVFPANLKHFDWPDDVEEMLTSGAHAQADVRYDEHQADEFLANALVHLTRLAKKERPTRAYGAMWNSIFSIHFLPRHRLVTDGVEEVVGGRRYASPWFSLPLFVPDPSIPDKLVYAHIRSPQGNLLRSLDLIRLDKFKPHRGSGFWIPTAIVRPKISKSTRALRFSMVYMFPTSPALYRQNFRIDPARATFALQQALQQKQGIWLAKLDPKSREEIAQVWQRAVSKPALFIDSPIFSPAEREAWRAKKRQEAVLALQSGAEPLASKPRPSADDYTDISTESDEEHATPSLDSWRSSYMQRSPRQPSEADQPLLGPGEGASGTMSEHPDASGKQPAALHEYYKVIPDESIKHPLQYPMSPGMTLNERMQLASKDASTSNQADLPGTLYERRRRFRWASPSSTQDMAGASSSVAIPVVREAPQLVEHDFFNVHRGYVPAPPIRPQPHHPWQAWQAESELQSQQAQELQEPSYLRSLHRDTDLNLDLSLAPPQPDMRRSS